MAKYDFSDFENNDYDFSDFDNSTALGSALRGVAQGASFGLADEITGGLEAGKEVLSNLDVSNLGTDYEKFRNESRENYKKAEQANPEAYLAGQIGGGIATSFVPGLGMAKGASLASNIGKAGAMGALQAYGTTENRDELIPATLGGAALGAASVPVANLIGSGISSVANKVQQGSAKAANMLAKKATGATGTQLEKFADDAGQQLLDRGIVTSGSTPEIIARRAQAQMDDAVSTIDDILKSSGGEIDQNQIINKLENKAKELESTSWGQDLAKQVRGIVDDIYASGKDKLSLAASEAEKRGFGGKINNWVDATKGAANKEAYQAYKSATEQALEGAPMSEAFKTAKQTYGLMAPIQEAAQKRANVLAQSPLGGLLDVSAFNAGEGGLSGLAFALGRKVAANRATSFSATVADKISKGLKSGTLQKFAPQLQSAMSRGNNAVIATDFLLKQTNPEYRKAMESDDE